MWSRAVEPATLFWCKVLQQDKLGWLNDATLFDKISTIIKTGPMANVYDSKILVFD